MKILKPLFFTLTALAMLGSPAFGQVLVNDDFADGLRTDSGAVGETDWYATNSSNVFDTIATPGTLGMNSGTSGRGMHTLFTPATLTNIGDKIVASFDFDTPDQVGLGGGAFRFGLFDSSGAPSFTGPAAGAGGEVAHVAPGQTVTGTQFLSGDLGSGSTNTFPQLDIDGYMVDLDVSPTAFGGALLNAASDFQFRTRDSVAPATGRLMGTTGSFTRIGSSGPDEGYGFGANSSYALALEAELVATGVSLTATLTDVGAGVSYAYNYLNDGTEVDGTTGLPITDGVPNTTFDYMQIHINSNQFGSTGDPDVVDNGITLTNANVTFSPASSVPEPGTAGLLLAGLGSLGLIRRRK